MFNFRRKKLYVRTNYSDGNNCNRQLSVRISTHARVHIFTWVPPKGKTHSSGAFVYLPTLSSWSKSQNYVNHDEVGIRSTRSQTHLLQLHYRDRRWTEWGGVERWWFNNNEIKDLVFLRRCKYDHPLSFYINFFNRFFFFFISQQS